MGIRRYADRSEGKVGRQVQLFRFSCAGGLGEALADPRRPLRSGRRPVYPVVRFSEGHARGAFVSPDSFRQTVD